ncbi:MAG: rod shape-determining protein [Asticcacaulis sp.]
MSNVDWLDGLHSIFSSQSDDLEELAFACGYDPKLFYIGTPTSGPEYDQLVAQIKDALIEDLAIDFPKHEVDYINNSLQAKSNKSIKPPVRSGDLAFDIGTETIRVYRKNVGVIFTCQNIAARISTGSPFTKFGDDVASLGTKSNWDIVRPVQSGRLIDDKAFIALIKSILLKVGTGGFINPKVIISVSSGLNSVHRRALNDAMIKCGARRVGLLDSPMASAMGAGALVHNPVGTLIIDIGAGTTDIAVLSLSGIVFSKTIFLGGDDFDKEIINYMRRNFNLLIGVSSAQNIKKRIGLSSNTDDQSTIEIDGRDLTLGVSRRIKLNKWCVSEALEAPLNQIADGLRIAIEACPPELVIDIDQDPILTGGGALMGGMLEFLCDVTGFKFKVANDPLLSNVLGCGSVLEHPRWMKGVID